jgi:purine-nucleoside phosphorylase
MNEAAVTEAATVLSERLPWTPEILAVLGSGLGFLADAVEEPVAVPFTEVPGLPAAGVEGHQGRYVAGVLEGRRVLIQAGRFHVYEGRPLDIVVAPVRIAARMGVERLLLTNAAGGVNRRLSPGDIMLIDDHLNLMGRNPLVGPVREMDDRFPDMTAPYDREYQEVARTVAAGLGLHLARGTYAAVTGPSYETPAEVRMIATLGGDAVGMSTVPEVIAARARGMRVLAFSLITNHAAGISPEPLSHEEVLEAGREAAGRFEALVRGVLPRLA